MHGSARHKCSMPTGALRQQGIQQQPAWRCWAVLMEGMCRHQPLSGESSPSFTQAVSWSWVTGLELLRASEALQVLGHSLHAFPQLCS